ncbi:unnamed protein product [Caenorhabditis brenneri]
MMVYPSSTVLSVIFSILLASTSLRCEATSVVTCMLCTVLSEPLETQTTPTAIVNAMFERCDKMGLMEPICAQFVSENVKDMFQRVRQGTPAGSVCGVLRFCDA